MHVRAAALLALVACLAPASALGHGTVGAATFDASLVPAGPASPCHDVGYEVRAGDGIECTHGPDPAPAGVHLDEWPSAAEIDAASTGDGVVPCIGDGQSGNRVQLVHARPAGQPSAYENAPALMQAHADTMSSRVRAGAAETGGLRDIRFVTDATCKPVVLEAGLSAASLSSFGSMISELRAQGLNRRDRRYVVWVQASQFCGIAQMHPDDRPVVTNENNGLGPGLFARVDVSCWGDSVALHELLHTLGAVQASAPNSTPGGHCSDEWDVMCYADAPSVSLRYACAGSRAAQALDCNHDDYFHTAPPLGTYLSAHWNTANSSFLEGGGLAAPSAPPAVRATASSETSVSIAWDAAAGAVRGYEVFVDGRSAATTTATSATLDRLACGRTYSVGVEAVDSTGNHSERVTANAATAACVDRAAPSVAAAQARGLRGRLVALRFEVLDQSESRAVVTVYRAGRLAARRQLAYATSAARSTTWRAPLRLRGPFRFCVVAFDRVGNASASSCARIVLR